MSKPHSISKFLFFKWEKWKTSLKRSSCNGYSQLCPYHTPLFLLISKYDEQLKVHLFRKKHSFKKTWTSLVVQWPGIHLPMQGAHRFDPLSGEIPQCPGPTEPMPHSYWACALEPGGRNCWVHEHALEPILCNKKSHFSKKPVYYN